MLLAFPIHSTVWPLPQLLKTPWLPVDNKLHYHTMPIKWLLSSLKPMQKLHRKCREHDFFTPHPHQTQGRADNPMHKYTAFTQLPTLCCPNPPGFAGKKIPGLLFQILINELRSDSPDRAPDLKGAWQGQRVTQRRVAQAWVTLHLRSFWLSHSSGNTHHNF